MTWPFVAFICFITAIALAAAIRHAHTTQFVPCPGCVCPDLDCDGQRDVCAGMNCQACLQGCDHPDHVHADHQALEG